MRTVLVGGREFTIPSDQDYIIRNEEIRDFDRVQLTTEFTFHPEPNNLVSVRTCERDTAAMFASPEGALPVAENWADRPPRELEDFLLGTDRDRGFVDSNPCSEVPLDRYNTTYERPIFGMQTYNHFYKPGLKPVANPKKKSPTRRSAVMPRPKYELSEDDRVRMRGLNSQEYVDMLKNKGKGKREPMVNKFPSGTRVLFRNPTNKKMSYATVVGVVDEMKGNERPGTILLCTDESKERFNHYEKYAGEGRGLMVNPKKAEIDEPMGDSWHTVPANVGVGVRKTFSHDGVVFEKGMTGRIVAAPDMERNIVLVSWNFNNDDFHSHEDYAGNQWSKCWEVPISKVGMCLLNYEKRILSFWPVGMGSNRPERKVKDICTVRGGSVSYVNEKTGREQILPEGAVVELLKNMGGSHRTWTCKLIGGCPDDMLEVGVNIRELYLKDHPHPERFYSPGQVVEIVAKVDFRKVALQGMKGKVILSTDTDGDVGIEFKEDIGAGSLDGIGKEGHCIYIEADLVKSSE